MSPEDQKSMEEAMQQVLKGALLLRKAVGDKTAEWLASNLLRRVFEGEFDKKEKHTLKERLNRA